MIEYIKGKLIEKFPTHAIIETPQGIAYFINISLAAYSCLGEGDVKLYIHQIIKEDAHLLYGFTTQSERAVFRKLLGVSGVGAASARTILSTRSVKEVIEAIITGDAGSFKAVKGVGSKTAEKIILELKSKMGEILLEEKINVSPNVSARNEAISALEVLGITRLQSEKIISSLVSSNPDISVEDLIKQTLRQI